MFNLLNHTTISDSLEQDLRAESSKAHLSSTLFKLIAQKWVYGNVYFDRYLLLASGTYMIVIKVKNIYSNLLICFFLIS